jgi:uncharacterized glyoxalase superfamily protein PhnB
MTHEHQEYGHDHDHEDVGPRHFFGVVPVFLVDDVVQTAEYYRDVFGFEVDFLYGDPPTYASVSRDDAIINFSLSQPPGRRNSISTAGPGNGTDAYIVISDLDDVFDEMRGNGANVERAPVTTDYGMREFQVQDLNGYRLILAEESDA